jgi:AsmA protein
MKAIRLVGISLTAVLTLLLAGVAVLYALFDGEKIKTELAHAMQTQYQRTLVIAGTPKLSVWPDVGIALQGVTLSEHASDANFVALNSARVSVAVMPLLSRKVQVRALELDGLQVTLVKHKDGTLNVADLLERNATHPADTTAAPTGTPTQPLEIDINAVRIANARFVWRDDKAGTRTEVSNLTLTTGAVHAHSTTHTASVQALQLAVQGKAGADVFTLALDAPQLNLAHASSSADAIQLSATLNGAARHGTVLLSLQGVQGNAQQLTVGSLGVKLEATLGSTTLKGQLNSPVTVQVASQAVALSKLVGSVDIADPAMPMKQVSLPIQGALQFNGAAHTAAMNMSTQLDDTKLLASAKVSQFSPLAVAFDVDLDQLNIDKYLPPVPPPAAGGTQPGNAPDAPLDLSALKGLTANGHVRIGALQVAKLKLQKINAKVALAGGRLGLDPVTLNLYDGSTSGSVVVNAQGNAMALKQNLVGVNVNPLLQDLLANDVLEGRGNVALDINTRGDTVGALKKALAGTAALALKDGAIKGINLAQTLRDAKAKLGQTTPQASTTQQANTNQQTDFSELTASFKIAGGVAHNDDLALKSPFLRLSGAGDIDIAAAQINYLAKATVVASGEGQGGQDMAQLKGLSVPVRVSGPFANLSYQVQWGAMLEDATKARVEAKKQEIQTKVDDKVKELKTQAEDAVKEKAKDLFKGILGR